jgi:hypothetical protein
MAGDGSVGVGDGGDGAGGPDASPSGARGGEEKNAFGLASHIQSVAWEEQDFSDVVVSALGKVGGWGM